LALALKIIFALKAFLAAENYTDCYAMNKNGNCNVPQAPITPIFERFSTTGDFMSSSFITLNAMIS
jgi:hypothetical protein